MSCSQATHYNTRTKAAALDVYQNDPESASPVIANAANNIRQHSLDELHTNQVYTLPYASITYVSLLRLPNHRFVLIYFTLYDLYCILFHPHLYIHYRLYFFWLLRFDVCNFPPQILILPRAIVTNVKCKLLCVRFYILIFCIFWICMLKWLQLDSIHFLIAKWTIAHSCNSALMSVPHSFEALNPNSDAISLSQL